MKIFDLEKYGNTYKIELKVASYTEGNLAITMTFLGIRRTGTLECPDCQSGFRPAKGLCLY